MLISIVFEKFLLLPLMKSSLPAPYHYQHELSLLLLILITLPGVGWNFKAVLFWIFCISLMAKDVEHLFKCFLTIQDAAIDDALFRFIPHLKI